MKRFAIAMLFCGLMSIGIAGTTEDAKEAGDQTPAAAKSGDMAQNAFSNVLGENGTIRYLGGMTMQMDENGNVIARLQKSVKVESDLFDLECDDLVVDQANQVLIAKASGIVKFTKNDAKSKVSGTCGKLTYYIDTKKTVLENGPKVKQTAEDGSVTEMSADEVITMTQVGDQTNINTEGGGEIRFGSGKKAESANGAKKNAPAEKIDDKSVRQIPSPSLSR